MQTSSPNTPPSTINDDPYAALASKAEVLDVDSAAAALADQLEKEQDSRKTERFYWVFGVVILITPMLIKMVDSNWYMLPLFLFEAAFLIGIAHWLGLERVALLLEKLFHRLIGGKEPT